MQKFPILLLSLFLVLSASTLSGQLAPDANNAHLILFVRNAYKASIKKQPITITSERTGQEWKGKTDGRGYMEILLPTDDRYFFDIGNKKKHDWVRISDRGWGTIKHTMIYNGPTKVKNKGWRANGGSPMMSDMPSLRDGKANILLTFRGMKGRPLEGEVVTLEGAQSKVVHTATSGKSGKVAFSVEPGDEYIVRLKYNQNFDVIRIRRHAGSVTVEGNYMYRGTKYIEKLQAQRDSIAKDMAKRQRRDEHGHRTYFEKGRVESLPVEQYAQGTEYGFDLEFERRTPITTPAWMDEKLYVSGGFSSNEFYCFDPATGKTLWRSKVSDIGASPVTCRENTVVANFESCTLFALDGESGKMRWSWWLGDPLLSSPTIDNGNTYTAYPDFYDSYKNPGSKNTHAFAAFDLKTGEVKWSQWIDGDIISSAVAVQNELYFSTYGGSVYRVRQEDGRVLAKENMWATSAPTLVDGQLYVTQHSPADAPGTQERVVLLDPQTLELRTSYSFFPAAYLDNKIQSRSDYQKQSRSLDAGNGWASLDKLKIGGIATPKSLVGINSVQALQTFTGSRVLHFNNHHYLTKGDHVVCLSAESGKEIWAHKVHGNLEKKGGYLACAPINAGGYIIVSTVSGKIVLLDPASGKVKKSWQTEHEFRSQPIAVNGWIYCASTSGRLAAINTEDPSISGWTALGANPQHTNINSSNGD